MKKKPNSNSPSKDKKASLEIDEAMQTKEDLRKKADRLGLIARVGQKTTAILELDELLNQAVKLISDTFDYYNVIIFLVDGNEIVLRATTLASIRQLEGKLRLRIGVQGITGWVAEKGQPLLIPDVTKDSRYYFVPEEKNTKSEIAVPIKLKENVIGVLDAQSGKPDAFSQADIYTLQTLADQLAVAIENARLYEQASQEIAERKKAEKALRKSEEKYRTLVEHLPLGVYRTSPDGKIIESNQTLIDLLGCESLSALSNTHVDDFYTKKKYRTGLLKKIDASGTYFTEFELRRKDNKDIWVRDYSRAVTGKDGKVIHYDGILADITERKTAEKKLKQALLELERSNVELQQFAYVASHDLQEPLRMVASFVKLLEERYKGKLDEDADEFIAFAVEGAIRMQKLINDLLSYSRVGTQGKSFEPTDCKALIDQVISNLKVSIEETHAQITYNNLQIGRAHV